MDQQRRFKKRYVALAAILLLAALLGSVVWRAVTAAPGPLIDYHQKMYDLSVQLQPAGPDEWPVFEGALAKARGAQAAIQAAEQAAGVENADGGRLPWELRDLPTDAVHSAGSGDPEEFAALQARGREWLESFAAAGLFEQTARLPAAQTAVRPLTAGPLLDVRLPYLGEARGLARIQAARMHMAAERGDWADYTAAVEELLAMARIIASQTTLIDYLVGTAIESLALAEVRKDLAAGLIDDPAAIDRLLAAIDRQQLPTSAHALEAERMFTLDVIQRVYTDNGKGDGRLILTEVAGHPVLGPSLSSPGIAKYGISNAAGFVFPSRARTVADLNRLFDPLIADAGTPAYLRTSEFSADHFVESFPRLQLVLRAFAPALGGFRQTADDARTIAAGTRLLLRLERHRLRTGAAPASLADLAAADPAADLIDPMTGEPFLYARLTDDPHGRPYLLYAAGADGRDDGGIEAEKGPAEQAFRRGRPGTDYVLNPPPQQPDWDE